MRVLADSDIRAIRDALIDEGYDVEISNGGDNAVIVCLDWSGLDDCDAMNGFEIACCVIQSVARDVVIRFLHSNSRVSCSLRVVGC